MSRRLTDEQVNQLMYGLQYIQKCIENYGFLIMDLDDILQDMQKTRDRLQAWVESGVSETWSLRTKVDPGITLEMYMRVPQDGEETIYGNQVQQDLGTMAEEANEQS